MSYPDPNRRWNAADVREVMQSVEGHLARKLRECNQRTRWLTLGALIGFPGAADEMRAIAVLKIRRADETPDP